MLLCLKYTGSSGRVRTSTELSILIVYYRCSLEEEIEGHEMYGFREMMRVSSEELADMAQKVATPKKAHAKVAHNNAGLQRHSTCSERRTANADSSHDRREEEALSDVGAPWQQAGALSGR